MWDILCDKWVSGWFSVIISKNQIQCVQVLLGSWFEWETIKNWDKQINELAIKRH